MNDKTTVLLADYLFKQLAAKSEVIRWETGSFTGSEHVFALGHMFHYC